MRILPNNIALPDADTHISTWILESGRLDHDQNMLPVILPLIKPGDWVIDGGGFIGDHTIAYLKAVGLGGKVIAFEPNPEAFECLRHNCPSALAFPFALGAGFGGADLTVLPNKGATFATESMDGSTGLVPLDFFNFPRVDFIKLDLEGMELKAIHGARQTITKHYPVILLELNKAALERNGTTSLELLEYVESLGYEHTKVFETDDLKGEQLDVLFFPKSKTLEQAQADVLMKVNHEIQ